MRKGLALVVAIVAMLFWAAAPASAAAGWTIQPTPNAPGSSDSQLQAISCTSASSCTAVGYYYYEDTPMTLTFVEYWNGSSWSIEDSPNPSNSLGSYLEGASCASASSCMAVGYYVSGSSTIETLAESWNGTTWSVVPTPNPSGTSLSYLQGVSCFSSADCTAVGRYDNDEPNTGTLAEHWNGTTWSIQATPDVHGSASDRLDGISCASAARCTAVGSETSNAGDVYTLAERWDGGKWFIQPTPNGSGSPYSELTGISCTTATNCEAVGASDNPSASNLLSLAEYWNGTTWVIQQTPNRPVAVQTELVSVWCTAVGKCTAAGSFEPASGRFETIAEHWNGTSWALNGTPNPHGARSRVLLGIYCAEHANCTAVGSYQPETGPTVTLAVKSP